MAELIYGPGNFFPNSPFGGDSRSRYPNPFYSVALQYLPLDITAQMWWADHFLLRFGFYRSAVFRIANYFITSLNIECQSAKDKEIFERAFENNFWKEQLAMAGVNLIAYGNTYASITPGFDRFLVCPNCGRTTSIDTINDYTFDDKGKFRMQCSRCKQTGVHLPNDRKSRNADNINITYYPPRDIEMRWENVTNRAEYYWNYPQDYVTKVTLPNNKFYSKVVPLPVYDAIYDKRLIVMNKKNFLHLALPAPAGIKKDGRGIPPCMHLFDDFFLLQVLRRYNEAICFEDIAPFRVISMAGSGGGSTNPILNQDSSVWRSAVNTAIEQHRRDPGSYVAFPFPMNYEQLGGTGKQLAPVDIAEHVAANILNSLNVPQELFNMQLKLEAVGPALRLFENTWSCMIDNYNRLLQKWADVIRDLRGMDEVKVSLVPSTLTDDMERKSVMGQLMGANAIAKSTFLDLYNLSFKDQLKKKLEEDQITQELQQEANEEAQQSGQVNPQDPNQQYSTSGATPQDVESQAQQIAQQLFPLNGSQRRAELQKIKSYNSSLWSHVKTELEQMTQQAGSQGVQGAKQAPQQQ